MKRSKLKQGLIWLSISASLTVFSLGGIFIYGVLRNNNTPIITVDLVTVTKGKVDAKITGESGILKFDNQRSIKANSTGTVQEIIVKTGDLVKKEQILIRLGDRESQIKLQEFELDLAGKNLQIEEKKLALQKAEKKLLQVQEDYKKLKANYLNDIENSKQEKTWEIEKSELQIRQKNQNISQLEQEVNEAKVKLSEDQQLFDKGFIPESELQEQQKKVTQSESNLTNANNELLISKINLDKQKLDLQNLLKNVQENRSESQQKLREIELKIDDYEGEVTSAKLALKQIIIEVDKLKLQRQKILEELQKTVIKSPINGVILNLKIKLGDFIEPKQELLVIGDTSQQIVELNLSPLDATKVQIGQLSEVTVIGLENEKLTGKIKEISLVAKEGQNNNDPSSNNVKITAIVGLDKLNKNIITGTSVAVTIIIEQREQVLTLPNEALQESDSESFVWMKDNQNKAYKKPVKIGLQGIENTEIISGLKEGDEVLIPREETPLNEGNIVTIK